MNSTRTTLVVFFLLATVCASFTLPAAAQSCCNNYQQFGLTSDLAGYLAMTAGQKNSINRQLNDLNFDWNLAVSQIADLENQAEAAESDSNSIPATIGQKVGDLTSQKIVIARTIIAEVGTVNKQLLAVLTPLQQAQLSSLGAVVNNAQSILNRNSDAYYANLFVNQYGVGRFLGFNTSAPSLPIAGPTMVANALQQSLREAVVRFKADKAKERAELERRQRFVPSEQ